MGADVKMKILLTAKEVTSQAFESVKSQCKELSSSVLSLNTVMAGLAGATGFGYLAKQTLDATAEIERNAKMAGVSVKAFQELGFAAGKYMVTQDALTDGLKELNLRTDEYVQTAGGSAKESFERLGFTQADLNKRLKDTPGLLREIISRMQDLDTAAQIRIADELFGGQGGEQFVAMIDAGAGALDGMIKRSRELGVVLDAGMIKKSIEAKKEIEELTTVLSVQFSKTVAELAPDIKSLAEQTGVWVKNNQSLIKEKVPEYIGDVRDSVKGIKEIYDEIPDDVKGPAGIGLVGSMMFGGKAGVVIGGLSFLYGELKDFKDGIKALSSGGISLDEFIGDERVFEDAIARYRELNENLSQGTYAINDQTQGWKEYAGAIDETTKSFEKNNKSTSGVNSLTDVFLAANEAAKNLKKTWRDIDQSTMPSAEQAAKDYYKAWEESLTKTDVALEQFFSEIDTASDEIADNQKQAVKNATDAAADMRDTIQEYTGTVMGLEMESNLSDFEELLKNDTSCVDSEPGQGKDIYRHDGNHVKGETGSKQLQGKAA